MNSKYEIGQKVVVRPVNNQVLSPVDSTIEPYIGQIGRVTEYYWISPHAGKVFYVYTVRMGMDNKKIVLHEDEIESV